MDDKQVLLNEIQSFLAEHAMKESTFGKLALKNGNFVSDLHRVDFSPKLKTATRVRTWMKSYTAKHKQEVCHAPV